MDSAAVSHTDPMVKRNNSSESEMDSAAVSHADPMVKGNKSSESEEKTVIKHFTPMSFEFEFDESDEVRRSYNPLSFYTSSTVYRPAPISAVNKFFQSKMVANEKKVSRNYIPLSYFTGGSTVYRKSSESKSVANEKKVTKNCIKGSSTKVNKSSESKVTRNSIPDEVFFSILSNLPIKSLKRFGCVCKSWSVFFENSDFMTMYSNHFISRHGSDDHYHTFLLTSHVDLSLTPDYFYNSEFHLLGKTLKFNLPPPFQHPCHLICILGSTSVNGIFCFGQEYPRQNEFQYVLWNPATEEFRVIPPSINERKPRYPRNNLFLQHVVHGFGYDQVRDDFKVVQFVSFNYDGMPSPQSKSFFEIYSLKSNSWRMINMKIDLCNCLYAPSFSGREVYVDGVCHWLVVNLHDDELVELTLLSFDLSNEAFITTPIGEESFTPYTCIRRLAVLNGSIALVSNYDDDIVFHISILGELGVTESWIKLYIYGPLPSLEWPPFGFGKTGYMFFKKIDGELAYVDLSTKKIEEVDITGGNTCNVTAGLYKKSLLSIGGSSK